MRVMLINLRTATEHVLQVRQRPGITRGDDFYTRYARYKSVMAKTSVVARSKKKPKFSTRIVRRCLRCGRKNGFMRDFGLCRICFREFANEGMIPGIKKSSW